jgi:cytochrome c
MIKQLTQGLALTALIVAPYSLGQDGEQTRWGYGRWVEPGEIRAWDIDVKPDGSGLPEGSGNVATGEAVYMARCANCHGLDGVGGSFDQLAGRIRGDKFPFGNDPSAVKTIGNYWPFATTLYDYINRAMPYDEPGSLSPNAVYSLVAYLLHLNDLLPDDATLSAQNLADIIMPARHRFVPDDRRGRDEFDIPLDPNDP